MAKVATSQSQGTTPVVDPLSPGLVGVTTSRDKELLKVAEALTQIGQMDPPVGDPSRQDLEKAKVAKAERGSLMEVGKGRHTPSEVQGRAMLVVMKALTIGMTRTLVKYGCQNPSSEICGSENGV